MRTAMALVPRTLEVTVHKTTDHAPYPTLLSSLSSSSRHSSRAYAIGICGVEDDFPSLPWSWGFGRRRRRQWRQRQWDRRTLCTKLIRQDVRTRSSSSRIKSSRTFSSSPFPSITSRIALVSGPFFMGAFTTQKTSFASSALSWAWFSSCWTSRSRC